LQEKKSKSGSLITFKPKGKAMISAQQAEVALIRIWLDVIFVKQHGNFKKFFFC